MAIVIVDKFVDESKDKDKKQAWPDGSVLPPRKRSKKPTPMLAVWTSAKGSKVRRS